MDLPPDDRWSLALRDVLAFVADSDFVRSVYLIGSLAEGNPIPTSDLDLMLVLRDASPPGVGGRLQESCSRLARERGVRAEVFTIPEKQVARYGRLVLPGQARCVLGDELSARHVLPSPADLARMVTTWAASHLLRGTGGAAPLRPPHRPGPWLGADQKEVIAPNGEKVPGTVWLVGAVCDIARARIGLRGGMVEGKGEGIAVAYRELVGDGWDGFIRDTLRRCRGDWHYLIPEGDQERTELRGYCETFSGFEERFWEEFRSYLLGELNAGFERAAPLIRVVRLLRLEDPEIDRALHSVAAPPGTATSSGGDSEGRSK